MKMQKYKQNFHQRIFIYVSLDNLLDLEKDRFQINFTSKG